MKRSVVLGLVGAAALAGVAGLGAWSIESAGSTLTGVFGARAGERLYEPDPTHSSVVFKIRHAGVSNFYGRFNDVKGEVHYDAENPGATRMAFTVFTDSVDTHNGSRDGHLKNADFFNSRQFPEISFKSTGLKAGADGAYTLTGDLTLMGETRPISATLSPFTTGSFMDTDRLGFEARFSIKRSDFGMTKYLAPDNGEGGALGNQVDLIVSIESVGK